MENLNEINFFEVDRPKIPQILLDATYDSMRGDSNKDKFSRSMHEYDETQSQKQQQQQRTGVRDLKSKKKQQQQEGRSRKTKKVVVIDDDDDEQNVEESPYRAHGQRRMGFLVIGDEHRFGHGKGNLRSYFYPDAPPIDFSFCLLSNIEEIVSAQEPPNTNRNYKFPEKTQDDRYKTSSVRVSYNLLENIEGLVGVLAKILDGGPLGLLWLDLSFNHLTKIDEDTLSQIPNLKILYLHGNAIADMTQILKLQGLPLLHTLTMHGNPIEEEDGYRACMIYYFPQLKHLDFIATTKGDRAAAQKYGALMEPYWEKRHRELENTARLMKAAEEISYTEELMMNREDEQYDTDFKALNLD